MSSSHLQCNLPLFTFSGVPNLILLTLLTDGVARIVIIAFYIPMVRPGIKLGSAETFFHFPFNPLSPYLASHFRTNWLSRLGLVNQVGSTTDHL